MILQNGLSSPQMRSQSHWKSAHKVLGYLQWASSVILISFAALLKVDLAKLTGALDFFVPSIKWVQSNAWWCLLVCAIFNGAAKFISSRIGAPWVWEHIHFLLDKFQELLFEGEQGEVHHHRVTLFKHVRCERWYQILQRDGGGLLSVERSGHTTVKSVAFFRAPDNADNAEGVAGWTWAAKRMVFVQDLPDIHAKRGENHRVKNVAKYAKETRITQDWLQKHHESTHARSFCGIPVEVKGRIWGVIIIDSRSPAFKNPSVIDDFWKINSRYFGKLLEKA